MILSDAQKATMSSWKGSEVGKTIWEVICAYKEDLKDDVLNERLDPKVGKAAMEKLDDFVNKIGVVGDGRAPRSNTPPPWT